MADIVTRLRQRATRPGVGIKESRDLADAADEIERLRNEVQELRDDLYRHGAESQ